MSTKPTSLLFLPSSIHYSFTNPSHSPTSPSSHSQPILLPGMSSIKDMSSTTTPAQAFLPSETCSFVTSFHSQPLLLFPVDIYPFHALIDHFTLLFPTHITWKFSTDRDIKHLQLNKFNYRYQCVSRYKGWMLSPLPLRHHAHCPAPAQALYALSTAPVNEWVSDQSEINSNILSSRWTSPNRLCFRHTSSLFAGEQAKLNSKTSA